MVILTTGGVAVPTVAAKVIEAVALPSLTVIVMFAEPVWPAAGVIVTVRLLPPPPNTIPATGITEGLEDVAASASEETGSSGSSIVNAIGPVAVFSRVI